MTPQMPLSAGVMEQRTVYLGQVDPETRYDELCAVVHGGPLELVRVRPAVAFARAASRARVAFGALGLAHPAADGCARVAVAR